MGFAAGGTLSVVRAARILAKSGSTSSKPQPRFSSKASARASTSDPSIDQMPYRRTPLDPAEMEALRNWIAEGATAGCPSWKLL